MPKIPTRVLQYAAKLTTAPADKLTELPGSNFGLMLRFQIGPKIRINLHSQVDGPTVSHRHCLHMPAEMDDSEIQILSINMTRRFGDSPKLPQKLSTIKRYTLRDTEHSKQAVPLAISEGPMRMILTSRPCIYKDALPRKRIPANSGQFMEIIHDSDNRYGQHRHDAELFLGLTMYLPRGFGQ